MSSHYLQPLSVADVVELSAQIVAFAVTAVP